MAPHRKQITVPNHKEERNTESHKKPCYTYGTTYSILHIKLGLKNLNYFAYFYTENRVG